MATIKGRSYLSYERRIELLDLAEFIADEYCPTSPVDPLAIANAKGITASFGNYGSAFDGLLEHIDGRFHIYCNLTRVQSDRSPRARFTIGHELGHFFIDEHRNALKSGLAPSHPSVCEYESDNPVEAEADTFASGLLLPATRFRAIARKASKGLPGVLRLAEVFQTSVTSTAIRYATLEIVLCAVIKWTSKDYAWKWLSEDFRGSGYRKSIETVSHVPNGSATSRALAMTEQVPAQGYFQTGATASTWFPYTNPYGSRNVILIEQAIRLGQYGVLTMLYPDEESL